MFKKKIVKILKNEDGFTLMEAVISIAALAIVSGFILQMFLVSNGVNVKARETDHANAVLFAAVELFKKQDDVKKYADEAFFQGATKVDISEKDHRFLKTYDENFNLIKDEKIDQNNLQKSVKFLLEIDVILSEETNAGALFEIKTSMKKYDGGKTIELAKLDTNKYFGN